MPFHSLGGDDTIQGLAGDDTLYGGDGDDILEGAEGKDVLLGQDGEDTLDGGDGTDTALYFEGRRAEVPVTENVADGTWTVTTYLSGTDTLVDVERVQFSDGTFLIDRTEDPSDLGFLYQLYDTAFDRIADEDGLEFYLEKMNLFGMTAEEVYDNFEASLEGEAAFSPAVRSMSNSQFVEFLYDRALGGQYDQAGIDGFVARLDAGESRYQITQELSGLQEHAAALSENFGDNWAWVSTSSYWQELADAIKDSLPSGAVGDKEGSADDDTYYHVTGNGTYSILDRNSYGWARDKFVFLDRKLDEVTFVQGSERELIMTTIAGEVITILDQFGGHRHGMEMVEFAGGIVLNNQNIHDKMVADMKTSGAILGSRYSETYLHEIGDGSYSITEYGSFSSMKDSLVFDDTSHHEVVFSRGGDHDLVLTLYNGETITVVNHFSFGLDGLEEIKFTDGNVLNKQAIQDRTVADMKSTGTVIGSRLQENYIHSLGDGSYSINDRASYSGMEDRLVLQDLVLGDVSLSQITTDDFLITLPNGEVITIVDQFGGGLRGVETIEFSDGEILNIGGLSLDEIYAMAGVDRGPEIAEDAVNTLEDTPIVIDVLANDSDPDGDALSILSTTEAANGTVSIANNQVSYTPNAGFTGIDTFTYSVVAGQSSPVASTVTVTVDADTSNGGQGTPLGDQTGTSAADVYTHTTGNGTYTIFDWDNQSRIDELIFTDLDVDDVTFAQTTGRELTMSIATGAVVTVNNHFERDLDEAIEQISFADGTVLDLVGIRAKSVADQKASGNVLGDDFEDAYFHELGDGSYTISDWDNYGRIDRLTFADVNEGDVLFSQTTGAELLMTLADGATVTVNNHFDRDLDEAIEEIAFADGTVLDLAGIRAKSVSDQKGSGNVLGDDFEDAYFHWLGNGSYTISDWDNYGRIDRLTFSNVNVDQVAFSQTTGSELTMTLSDGAVVTVNNHFDRDLDEAIEEIAFNDGTILDLAGIRAKSVSDQKGSGNVLGDDFEDAYFHWLGNGSYTISDWDNYGRIDRLTFIDQNENQVAFSQTTGSELTLTLSDGAVVTVNNHFDRDLDEAIEEIAFADGTVLNLAGIRARSVADQKESGTVIGDDFEDTYFHENGVGSYTIYDWDNYGRTDRLTFTESNVDAVSFSQTVDAALVMTLSDGDVVTVNKHFDRSLDEAIEEIAFADGTVFDLAGIRAKSVSDQKASGTVIGDDFEDVYFHRSGDGSYTIFDWDNLGRTDLLSFVDASENDVSFAQMNGADLVMTVSDGSVVTIYNHFAAGDDEAIEAISFSDGTVLDLTGIAAKAVDDMAVV